MPETPLQPADSTAATSKSVVAGLGYPNGRAETSPTPTGWSASKTNVDGSADQASATVTVVGK